MLHSSVSWRSNETRPTVLPLRDIGSGAGKLGAFEIELVRDSSHAVIGLRDTRRGEGISRDDIGAGTEVSEMNLTNLRGLR